MARRRNKFGKWVFRIFLILVGIIFLVTFIFYLFREQIKQRAITYFNTIQNGELVVDRISLIPLMNFPAVSVKAEGISYYEDPLSDDTLVQKPVIAIDDFYLSLDIRELIRGDIKVTRSRMQGGSIFLVQGADSMLNILKALGPLLESEGKKAGSEKDTVKLQVDLDKLQLSDLDVILDDRLHNNYLDFKINRASCNFSYMQDKVRTGLRLNVDIHELNSDEFNLKKERNVQFVSDVVYLPQLKKLIIDPSMASVSGTRLEVWGEYLLKDTTGNGMDYINLTCRATNTGLDLLNFLFNGILDMDELEQVGSGSIYMSGSVKGFIGKGLPEVKIDCKADQLAFRIKSLDREVSGISFTAFATNGRKSDLSGSVVLINDFRARFPQGFIRADIDFENAVSPKLDVDINASMDMSELERIIRIETVREMHGHLGLKGALKGRIDKSHNLFFGESGNLVLTMKDLNFILPHDTVQGINGDIYMEKDTLGTRNMEVVINDNHVDLSGRIINLVPYLFGFDRNLTAEINLESDSLYPGRLIRDSATTTLMGDVIRGLKFSAGAFISHDDLDAWRSEGSVPRATLVINNFQTQLSAYANIADVKAALQISPDTIILEDFSGKIGGSAFDLDAAVSNYNAFSRRDSTAEIGIAFQLASDLMRAEDFFTVKDGFLLPETYRSEYLENLLVKGGVKIPVMDMLLEDKAIGLKLLVEDLRWNFRNYPLDFRDFYISASRLDNEISIEAFRGKVGESNLQMSGFIGNTVDSTGNNIYGKLAVRSELLDINELLNYQVNNMMSDSILPDTLAEAKEPPGLHEIDYPDLELRVDIGELRYDAYRIFGMNGKLRSTSGRIFYLDSLRTSGESGGELFINGQFSVASPAYYTLSADLALDDVNIIDLKMPLTTGQDTFTLQDNFAGLIDATGMAEMYFTPDMKLDMSLSTAMFNVTIRNGALIKFTPLHAIGKYLGNKNLDYVKFADLHNDPFHPFTLVDSRITIPLMSVGSTIGQLLIEGEQGFDGSYVYLVLLPVRLVKEAAFNVLSDNEGGSPEDDAMYSDKVPKDTKFMYITVWSNENGSDVKLGNRRDKIK